jgi:DNA-binding XRE family transcriptional regulator
MQTTAFTLDLSPVRRFRHEAHLSVQELAAAVGVDWTTVWRWETKGVVPNGRELVSLARAFGRPITDLFIVKERP